MSHQLNRAETADAPKMRRTTPTDAPVIGKVLSDPAPCLAASDVMRLPTVSAEAGRFGPLWVQACSIAGRSHLSGPDPTSGQDSYCSLLSADGSTAVFAVADGLGSRRRSHVGASIAARAACRAFAQPWARVLLDGPTGPAEPPSELISAMLAIQDDVLSAESTGQPGREVATTLLVALVDCVSGQRRACFVRVGDPDALLLPDGRFHSRSLVFGADNGGAANSLQACIPMKHPSAEVEYVRVGELASNVMVGLVSDGVGNDLRGSQRVRTWLEESWGQPLDANAMLDTLRYRRQGSSDDRTALLVHLCAPSDQATTTLASRPVTALTSEPTTCHEPIDRATEPAQLRIARRHLLTNRTITVAAAAALGAIGVVVLFALTRSLLEAHSPKWELSPTPSGAMVADKKTNTARYEQFVEGQRQLDLLRRPVVAEAKHGSALVIVDNCLDVWVRKQDLDNYRLVHAPLKDGADCPEPVQVFLQGDRLFVVRGKSLSAISLANGKVTTKIIQMPSGPLIPLLGGS